MSDIEESKNVDLKLYIEAVSAMISLPIPDASKPIVLANLEVAQRMAALIDEFDIEEREEPAPVFRP